MFMLSMCAPPRTQGNRRHFYGRLMLQRRAYVTVRVTDVERRGQHDTWIFIFFWYFRMKNVENREISYQVMNPFGHKKMNNSAIRIAFNDGYIKNTKIWIRIQRTPSQSALPIIRNDGKNPFRVTSCYCQPAGSLLNSRICCLST
jgi:hypothetical protein